MRQEATSDIIIIVVESGDERAHILASLAQLAGRRIIVALPDDGVFHRPADLRELKQVAAHVNIELTLVIASNERLRLWARAQGFTVFSSLETGTRSLASTSSFSAPKTSGQFKVPGVPMKHQTSRITEPLYMRPMASRVPNPASDLPQGSALYTNVYMGGQDRTQGVDIQFAEVPFTDTPVDIQLIDVQKALEKQIAEEKVQDRLLQPLSLLSNAPSSSGETTDRPLNREHTIWHDRLLFILVALLALGIVGGLSFGYLLSLSHTTALLPASLALVDQVVRS